MSMKFKNVALYCKGWYNHRDRNNIPIMWMDLAHCINADGWTVTSKNEVATWCMHRFDDWKKELHIDFSIFWQHVEDHHRQWDWNHDTKLSIEDAIIWTMYTLISMANRDNFDGVPFLPDERVLPLHYRKACYFPNISKEYCFADMHCDVQKRINKSFPNGIKQTREVGSWVNYNSFEYVEGLLKNKSWKDVLVINGSDSLLDCEEFIVTGKFLKVSGNEPLVIEKEHIWEDGSISENFKQYLRLGIYDNCIDFEEDKKYIIRASKDIYGYVLKSVKEI